MGHKNPSNQNTNDATALKVLINLYLKWIMLHLNVQLGMCLKVQK